jgi:hypothetical protein
MNPSRDPRQQRWADAPRWKKTVTLGLVIGQTILGLALLVGFGVIIFNTCS